MYITYLTIVILVEAGWAEALITSILLLLLWNKKRNNERKKVPSINIQEYATTSMVIFHREDNDNTNLNSRLRPATERRKVIEIQGFIPSLFYQRIIF